MSFSETIHSPADLSSRWRALREAQPSLRNREAAEHLGVSEAELIACRKTDGNFRLDPDWSRLFAGLPTLGRVMALTRNENAVHERRGTYAPASFENHVGLVLGPDIDLRIFLKNWAFGFAVEESFRRGILRSIQVFDRSGAAVHKIYAEAETDMEAWHALTESLRSADPDSPLSVAAPKPPAAARPIAEIDAEALLNAWRKMQDTHEFFGLLHKTGANPTQAFRLAEGLFTARLENAALRDMFDAATLHRISIMVFVGNPGIIQIHSGPVARVEVMGEWLNVLDPDFNLHLREDRVSEVWRVRKPTADGTVTSVEAFDAAGERIATFFGSRKPGAPELQSWRALVEGLPALARDRGAAA